MDDKPTTSNSCIDKSKENASDTVGQDAVCVIVLGMAGSGKTTFVQASLLIDNFSQCF